MTTDEDENTNPIDSIADELPLDDGYHDVQHFAGDTQETVAELTEFVRGAAAHHF